MSDMSEDHPNPFDITVVITDGKAFQAHRNVLSQASPFFEKLLNTDMKENYEGVIRLEWITESLMADILQFVYTGNVQISTQQNAEKLMATADYLLLSNLKTIAGKFIEQQITTVNCISIYNSIAEQYSCEDLIDSTQKFIYSNFTTVAASADFLNLPISDVEKWISSDEIVIDAEENVFEIIIRWIYHDESERSVKFSELFRHVRLTTLSRDFLLCDVVTNDLVKGNKDCLDSVTGALHWINRSTDCDVPRPHSPRNSLKTSVIVITDFLGEVGSCLYLPATDEWYRMPAIEGQRDEIELEGIFVYSGKLFAVTGDITRSQCYNPDLNRWSPAPWTKLDSNLPFKIDTVWKVLVVKNQICFIGGTTLWTYNLDSNSVKSFFKWVQISSYCAVAGDRYIYVIGGTVGERRPDDSLLFECARFDTEEDKWQNIAPLNEARRDACGVCKNEKIFIAGGCYTDGVDQVILKNSCEVYNIPTDEWQLIANLTLNRRIGSMVLVDDVLYVLGGRTSFRYYSGHRWSDTIECYDHESNKWNNKAVIPVNKLCNKRTAETKEKPKYWFKGCSLQVFKGVLSSLEAVDRD